MNFLERKTKKGDKIVYYYDFGRGKGQRPTTGIFIYTNPKDQIQKNHNKQALNLIELKKSQLIIESQAVGTGFIPPHKFKANFLEYYEEYVVLHKRKDSRHLQCSLKQFKLFIEKDFVAPIEINENLCKRFRRFLLDKYTGETPLDYYTRFKWVLAAATTDGYFRHNPTEKVSAKSNPSAKLKEFLEVEEYLQLLKTPCFQQDVQEAFIFCCYTGLRWVDVSQLRWEQLKGSTLTTRIIQHKTGLPVTLTLHPIARMTLEKRRNCFEDIAPKNTEYSLQRVFNLPSHDGANKIIIEWVRAAGIDKHITWSCARLSFSILLQDKLVDDVTVAYLLGHSTTVQVQKAYKRHRPKDQQGTIANLPTPELLPYFLNI